MKELYHFFFQLKLIIFKPGNETLDLTKSDFSHRLLRHDLGTQPSMNEDACCLQQVTLRTILFTDVAVNIKNTECQKTRELIWTIRFLGDPFAILYRTSTFLVQFGAQFFQNQAILKPSPKLNYFPFSQCLFSSANFSFHRSLVKEYSM